MCGELGITLLTQRRLGTLINELDAIGLLNSKVVSMGRYGRTKKIRLEIARSMIQEVFTADSRLARMINYEPKFLTKKTH
jgi:cell division control protein 6